MLSAFHPCPSHTRALIFARSLLAPRAPLLPRSLQGSPGPLSRRTPLHVPGRDRHGRHVPRRDRHGRHLDDRDHHGHLVPRRDPLVDAPTAAATCCTMGPAAPQHGGRAPGRCRPGPLRVSRPVVGARSFRILPVLHGANFVQSKGCGLLSGCVPEQTPVPSWKDRPRTAWARYPRGTCPARMNRSAGMCSASCCPKLALKLYYHRVNRFR